MKLIAVAAVAAGLAIAGSASAAGNLISNGSFESGTLDWTYSGSGTDLPGHMAVVIPYNSGAGYPGGAFGEPIPPDNAPLSGSPDPVGNNALYFVADNSTESLSQTVNLNAGFYTIGFDVYVPFNGKNNSGDATFDGSIAGVDLAHFSAHSVPGGQWFAFRSVVNIATAGPQTAAFTYKSGPAPAADFVVDRAYIVAGEAVPEPASWALMIVGFGATGAMLRRRQGLATA
ncbi:MAG: PEPxxWA-CTERM sorting domain-containing protein [Phenylobacterium sp.]